ncbi:MAG: ATP-binding protein [Bacteroidota bacterium]
MYERKILNRLKTKVEQPHRIIQLIQGPRQTGKTTLIKQLIKTLDIPSFYVSAEDSITNNESWIHQQWKIARAKLDASASNEMLMIIDDIQKIQSWKKAVISEWEEGNTKERNIQLIVVTTNLPTFSQPSSGNFEITQIPHWSFNEMQEAFGFTAEQYALYGGYPKVSNYMYDENDMRSYIMDSVIEKTLSKDVFRMDRINKPALFNEFFQLACTYSGQIHSFTRFLSQLNNAGNTTTLSHYTKLLDEAGLIAGIGKMQEKKTGQRGSIPKWQVQNNALLFVKEKTNLQEIILTPEKWDFYIESSIGAHLLNIARHNNMNLYYWKNIHHEVDFILQSGQQKTAIEIQSHYKNRKPGIKSFVKKHVPDKIFLIGKGGTPWKDFLKKEADDFF